MTARAKQSTKPQLEATGPLGYDPAMSHYYVDARSESKPVTHAHVNDTEKPHPPADAAVSTGRRPLRVLYTMSEYIDGRKGSCHHFLSVVRGLRRRGHCVFVAAPRIGEPLDRQVGDGRLLIPLPHVRMVFLVFQVLLAMCLPGLALLWQPEALMIRALPGAYWLVALAGKLLGMRVVVEVNGIPWEEMDSRGLGRISTWVARWSTRLLCRCADEVISVTPGISEAMRQMTGMAPERFTTVQNAVDVDAICAGRRETIREELGLSGETFVAGFIGTFDVWHGMEELVRSIEWLDDEARAGVVYVFAGDGERREATQAATQEYGEAMRFPGRLSREQVRDWLAAFDIGIFITQDERKRRYGTSPLKFWEYLAAGLPVLITDEPNLTPIVRENNMGLVIDEATPQAIGEALTEAYHRREELAEIGRRNAAWAKQFGSWDHACRRIERTLGGR
jgi:glycosyltransferase involved in cell wall biosynthesis